MSERADKSMHTLKRAIDTATGGNISDEDIIAILKGETPLDHPVALVLAETGILAQGEIAKASGIEFNTIHDTYCAALEIEGAATPEELADHPEVVRRKVGPVWPPDKPFPADAARGLVCDAWLGGGAGSRGHGGSDRRGASRQAGGRRRLDPALAVIATRLLRRCGQ